MLANKKITEKEQAFLLIWISFFIGFFANEELGRFLTPNDSTLGNLAAVFTVVFVTPVTFWAVHRMGFFSLPKYTIARLFLLGIAIASFVYALVDVADFYGHGLNFGAFLSSIALGGLLGLFERLVDLKEKGIL